MSRQPHYVYVIATAGAERIRGPVKVGYTNNPNSRLNSLRTGNPEGLEIACVFEFPEKEIALWHERAFHHVMRAYRLEGEWFFCGPVTATQAMCINVKAWLDQLELDPAEKEQAYYLSGAWHAEMKVTQERYRSAWENQ